MKEGMHVVTVKTAVSFLSRRLPINGRRANPMEDHCHKAAYYFCRPQVFFIPQLSPK
jgi:hypothetical protein